MAAPGVMYAVQGCGRWDSHAGDRDGNMEAPWPGGDGCGEAGTGNGTQAISTARMYGNEEAVGRGIVESSMDLGFAPWR